MAPMPTPNDPLEAERELSRQIDAVRGLSSIVRSDTRTNDSIRAASALVGGTRRVRLAGSGEAGDVAEIGSWCFRAIGLGAIHDHPHDLVNQPSGLDPGDVIIFVSTVDPSSTEKQALRRASATGINTIGLVPRGAGSDFECTVRIDVDAPRPVSLISGALMLARIAATLEADSEHANSVSALEGRMNDLEGRLDQHLDDVFARFPAESARVLVSGSGPLRAVAAATARLLRETRGYWAMPAHGDDVLRGHIQSMGSGDLLVELTGAGEMSALHEQIAQAAGDRSVARFHIGAAVAGPEHRFDLDAELSPAGAILTLMAAQYAVLGTLTAEAVG